MERQEKVAEVERLKASFSKAKAVLFADFRGVTSNEMNDLRVSFRNKGAEVRVVKNNLVRWALKGGAKEKAVENLAGATVAFFAYEDAAAVAKALTEYAKKVEALQLKDSFLGDEVMKEAQIKALAALPPREVLVAQLLGVMNGPIRSFVTVLSAVPRGFVCALQAIADKKDKEGGAQ